jgi:hypothetical protein
MSASSCCQERANLQILRKTAWFITTLSEKLSSPKTRQHASRRLNIRANAVKDAHCERACHQPVPAQRSTTVRVMNVANEKTKRDCANLKPIASSQEKHRHCPNANSEAAKTIVQATHKIENMK